LKRSRRLKFVSAGFRGLPKKFNSSHVELYSETKTITITNGTGAYTDISSSAHIGTIGDYLEIFIHDNDVKLNLIAKHYIVMALFDNN
jgi:hypothetical protein